MSKERSFSHKMKQAAFRSVLGLVRIVPGATAERAVQSHLIQRCNNDIKQLTRIAWAAEEAEDYPLAIKSWLKVTEIAAEENDRGQTFVKAANKFALLESKLRRRVLASEKTSSDMIWPETADIIVRHKKAMQNAIKPGLVKRRLAFLQTLWNTDIAQSSSKYQAGLRRAYGQKVTGLIKEEQFDNALMVLQPLLAQWPDYQTGQRLYYRAVTDEVAADPAKRFAKLDAWWAHYHANKDLFDASSADQIWTQTTRVARKMIGDKRAKHTERLVMPAFQEWPDNSGALSLLAEASELRRDWRGCADRWQLLAAVSNPVTTKSRTHVAQNTEEMARRTKHACNQLRRARIKLAKELHAQGKRREFAELTNRIVESLADHRVMKKEREIIDLIGLYVKDALREDGVAQVIERAADNKPMRIAICLDVLKISDVHTHSRVVFAMCRNLMEMNPNIETHIIVTNERFAVTTPVVAASFSPVREAVMEQSAQAALPEFYGSRFFLHVLRNTGLEGLVSTSKEIIDIAPDVILYGGGHRGLFSNESRVVRHCLYDHFPSAFFYIQANNEVDDKLDMIIARGPHEIEGNKGKAAVRVQPYPTIVKDGFVNEVPIDMEKHARKHIVSAITGVRMDVRMKDIDRGEMNKMMSILDKVPGAVWHLIGATDPKKVIESNPVIKARVKAGQMVVHPVLPFEEFTELVGQSSLFFHIPGFTGGSGGATVARRGGIPIVTFEHSDVSGRQPAETVFASDDLAGAVAKSVSVLNDADKWRSTVEAQFAHTNWILETSASGFYDCLSETLKTSRARLDPKVVQLRVVKSESEEKRRANLSVV